MGDRGPKSYAFLTGHFKFNNFPFLMKNSWNQSLYKVLALQKLHGFEKFLPVFTNNPRARDAERYVKAGLVFCTLATEAQMLAIIELAAHGLYFPFRLNARLSGYVIDVEPKPNPAFEGFTPEQITAANRASFEEVVAAAEAAEATQAAEEAAEREAELIAYHAEKAARAAALAAAPVSADQVVPAGVTLRSQSRSRK